MGKNVLLLNMPFVDISRPALGISLLKARLLQEGIQCRVGYPNILFAEWVGIDNYRQIDDKIGLSMLFGDWLFAQYLFGDTLDIPTYLNSLRQFLENQEEYDRLLQMRNIIDQYLQQCLVRWTIADYDIIGFTTTFQQNFASLALAYKIKTQYPDKIIVFGGGNCEGIMGYELHRSFPWIDFICCGEADNSFPQLVNTLQNSGPDSTDKISNVKGIIYREGNQSVNTGSAELIRDMNQLPVPDYDDYFHTLWDSPLSGQVIPVIQVENARGCWWGSKSHCTFCGLNGDKITFRSKSANRVLEDLHYLKNRYNVTDFSAVDNVMDMKYFKDMLPLLKEQSLGISLFYEVKANLKKDQVKLLKEAGIHALQPGIESLNTRVLKIMRKGVSALQNIQLLKWCQQYGVHPYWNFIYGFPGETGEDYEKTGELVESLFHLPPPYACGSIRVDRFSPFFNNPAKYGVKEIKPFPMYFLLYPLPFQQVYNLAYYFEFRYENENGRQAGTYAENVLKKIDTWKESGGGELVKYTNGNSELMLMDTRPNRVHPNVVLYHIQRDVYEFCDTTRSIQELENHIKSSYNSPAEALETWLRTFLSEMVDWKLMANENDRYLSLALEKEVVG